MEISVENPQITDLHYNPGTPLLGMVLKDLVSFAIDVHSTMFVAVYVMLTRKWKQPNCSSTDEQMRRMWHIYTMEYNSTSTEYKVMSFVGKWMDLEKITEGSNPDTGRQMTCVRSSDVLSCKASDVST